VCVRVPIIAELCTHRLVELGELDVVATEPAQCTRAWRLASSSHVQEAKETVAIGTQLFELTRSVSMPCGVQARALLEAEKA
jgi:hypothetical protein